MSRQTLVVIAVTVALVLFGAVLLYGRPASEDPRADARPAAAEGVVSKAKAKSPERRSEANRSVVRAIPPDRPAAPAEAPNVVLAVLTVQRRDQWAPYGGEADVTPFLAARAAVGVRMADALAVAVDSAPALAAILTGRFPHALGAVDVNAVDGTLRIAPEASTLAERFAGAGWHTIGLTAAHEVNRSHSGAQGFDVYMDAQENGITPGSRIGAQELVKAALARVKGRPEDAAARPLFLQVVFNDSHKPMIRLGPDEAKAYGDALNPELGPYRATVRRQDDALAALVSGLEAAGVSADNTLFVVLGDHGEGLRQPERHRPQHGIVLYASAVGIPWLWWGQGVARGAEVGGLASQIDLAPTLFALAGLPNEVGDLDGIDLSAAVRTGGASPRTEAYADTFVAGFHRASVWTRDFQCQADYGSTNRPPDDDFESGCFDRKADPDFERAIERADLLRRLEALHQLRLDAVVAPVPASPPAAPPTP